MPEEPGPPGEIAGQRELLSRLRAVVEVKEAENAVPRAELDAERELRRRLELRLAELERRLSMDSSDSGTPTRRKADVAAGIPAAFTGLLMTDGYTGYQHLLSRLAGIQQCCQHVIRRCRAVIKLATLARCAASEAASVGPKNPIPQVFRH